MSNDKESSQLATEVTQSQAELLKKLENLNIDSKKESNTNTTSITNEFKSKIKSQHDELAQLIQNIKAEREDNVLRLLDIKDSIDQFEEKVKYCEENNMKIGRSSAGDQRRSNIDMVSREKAIEMIKKEEKNEYLSWELMTRLYALIFNASKNELIELSEQEQKGIYL